MSKIVIRPFEIYHGASLTKDEESMHALGVMKTIYVPPHPYVEAVRIAMAENIGELSRMYRHPHRHSQDPLHREFFDRYIDWSRSAVDVRSSEYPYQYPTAGSSEAIRETIAHYGNQERARGRIPQIHVFDGEYEGYKAYAEAHHVEVVIHDRGNYKETLEKSFLPGQRFYMSTPSGIDGNIWGEYDEFLLYLENKHAESKLMIDLAYINTTAETPNIRTDSSVIEAIFLSMSKSFPGTYYDRIGGVVAKSPIPGLYGNQWFKNLAGLFFGKTLMENSPLGEIPREMKTLQLQVIKNLRSILGNDLQPSDVTFIATRSAPENLPGFEKELVRAGRVRYCLTPGLDKLMSTL